MSYHRRPVMPASFTAKSQWGTCRWCGLPTLKADGSPARLKWHPACVDAFKLATWPAVQRVKVFERDKGICANCQKDTMAEKIAREGHWWKGGMPGNCGHLWQADHIRALCLGDRDMRLFGLDNLQTLCTDCHRRKTTGDVRAMKLRKTNPHAVAVQESLL